jgi:hypothetical protein
MAQNGTNRHILAQKSTKEHKVAQSGTFRHKRAQSSTKWHISAQKSTKWHISAQKSTKWHISAQKSTNRPKVAHFGPKRHKVAQVLAGSPNEPETARPQPATATRHSPRIARIREMLGLNRVPAEATETGRNPEFLLFAGRMLGVCAVAVGAGGCCVLSLCRLSALLAGPAAGVSLAEECGCVCGCQRQESETQPTQTQPANPTKLKPHADTPSRNSQSPTSTQKR